MSGTGCIRLEDRAVLRVAGADARDFLQGLLTCDMSTVLADTPRHGALLTPQGKILFEAIIHAREPGAFLFDTDKALAGELLKRLTFYRLRAAVTLEAVEDLCVVAGEEADAALPADPRLAALGRRGIVACQEAASENGDPTPYHIRRIANGIAELGRDYESGAVFPHEANFDQLGGVSFTKGCYIGQEVVSRMQHRGTARSRFVPVAIDGPPPARGAAIEADEKTIGTMGSSLGGEGIALLRLDRLEDAVKDGLAVTCGASQLTARQPGWANYTVAQAGD
ncbi:MAG: folate-binding protein YgfZ [Rhodobiaceae bacterium]|nr:folate-binding protein YgfZ [Rhodobiaceae bacterium]MCC0054392.1 folate-binding protein YgfZ [Rhodobiaceae bacterium]